jgi:transitional endoplasmic reticulum ATPase
LTNETKLGSDGFVSLKVTETNAKFVGKGMALIDPAVVEEMKLTTGDVIEITTSSGKKKTFALLWSGQPEDYGLRIVRIDGYTRNNLGIGIDDHVKVRKAQDIKKAEQIVISPTEELNIVGIEEYLNEILEGRVVSRGDVIPLNIMGRKTGLVVNSIMPSGTGSAAYSVSKDTEFILSSLSKAGPRGGIPRVSYEDIGGLRNEVQKVREMIELPLRHPEIFERIGIEAPKGVLLHGPPGTGKTLLAQAVANETNANYYSIAGPEIMSKFYGESEERLRDTFKQAQDNSPAIVFIDELDSIAPKRDEVSGDVEKRIVSQLLTLMDGLEARGKVVVIGATNRVNSIDPALRRPGRFDREIEIGIPDEEGRLDILHIHTRGMPLTDDVKLEYFAKITHGFVGADLESLCKEAAMRSLTRVIPEINLDQTKIPIEVLNKIKIGNKDFEEALKDIHPSAMREVQIQKPNVKWEDVGGLANVKDELSEAIEWPLKHADLFDEADIKPPKGILLYGSPGTGKTMIAKAVATNSEANFISIKGPELISKWVGESEKGVREVFRKAKQAAPSVIFFDEIDAIAPRRGGTSSDSNVTERVVSQLLTELDGLEDLRNVVTIGATNRIDIVDDALLRPGRFDRIVEVPIPDKEARMEILRIHTKKKVIDDDVNFGKLVELTTGWTGADIGNMVNTAALSAIKERITADKISRQDRQQHKDVAEKSRDNRRNKDRLKVSMRHFQSAIEKVNRKNKPSQPI